MRKQTKEALSKAMDKYFDVCEQYADALTAGTLDAVAMHEAMTADTSPVRQAIDGFVVGAKVGTEANAVMLTGMEELLGDLGTELAMAGHMTLGGAVAVASRWHGLQARLWRKLASRK